MPKEDFSVEGSSSLTNLTAGSTIHIIGVCGVAMAQLALTLSDMGFCVSGSDKEFYDPMGGLLKRSRVQCKEGFDGENIPDDVSLVVIGNAISYGNPEVLVVEQKKLAYSLFPKLLYETIIDGGHSIVVTGTHGKSTTSAILSFVLTGTGKSPGYFVGAVIKDLPDSLHRGAGWCSVVEGDEYDSAFFAKVPKFSFYDPQTLIVTSIEYDHADIYPDLTSINKEFSKLVNSRGKEAAAICCTDFVNVRELVSSWRESATCKIVTYGEGPEADYRLVSIKEAGGMQEGVIRVPGGKELKVRLQIPGAYNMKNAVAVIIAAERVGVSPEQSIGVIAQFSGLKRRQDIRAEGGKITLIEDFAHHPTAVKETLSGIRARYGDRKLWALFEPRSATSRRRVFQKDYVNAFLLADQVILCEVLARGADNNSELLDVKELSDAIQLSGVPASALLDANAIFEKLRKEMQPNDLIVVMSNGSFGGLIDLLVKEVSSRAT